jgi:hypothetical protein
MISLLSMVKICINIADPVDDAIMAPNSVSYLRAHLGTRPPSILCGTTPLIPIVVDAGKKVHRSTSEPSPTSVCSTNDAPGGEWRHTSPSSDSGNLDLRFAPEQPGRGDEGYSNDAFNKVDAQAPPSSAMTEVGFSFHRHPCLTIKVKI